MESACFAQEVGEVLFGRNRASAPLSFSLSIFEQIIWPRIKSIITVAVDNFTPKLPTVLETVNVYRCPLFVRCFSQEVGEVLFAQSKKGYRAPPSQSIYFWSR